jgi:16S rRNA processing protein RimM
VDPTAGHSYKVIARITRPRGNRGEVLVELHTDFPDRFDLLKQVRLEFPDGRRESYEIEDCWDHQGRRVLKFHGVDSISAAEGLAGAWIEVAPEQVMPLPPGTYWDSDLVGCTVRTGDGRNLGVVREIWRIAGNDQLVVAGSRGEWLVPVVAAFCKEVSIVRKEIVVDLPEGLLDLNE